MSGETGQRFATQAELQELAAQMATQADLKELELDLRSRMVAQREQMRAGQPGSRGAGIADFKRKLNRHAVAASVVTVVSGIILLWHDEIAAWGQEVVLRFFS